MELVSYALFADPEAANRAVEAVSSTADEHHPMDVVVHRNRLDMSSMDMFETDAREGVREGAVVGFALGAIAALIVVGPVAMAGGAVLGILYGSIAGGLAGASAPDRRLEQLSKELAAGKILVVVGAPDIAHRDRADDILIATGGRVQHKPFF